MTGTPTLPHYCGRCVFLGTVSGADLYACGGMNVLARWGAEASQYGSGLEFAGRDSPLGRDLAEAVRRAVARGLLDLGEPAVDAAVARSRGPEEVQE